MVKRVVNRVDVVDVEKRRVPSKHYVYVVNVSWSDGSKTVVYRRYSRFFELQVRILELFPEEGGEEDPSKRMIPFLPGKIIFGRSHVRNVAMKRLNGIDEYCKALIRLPSHLSECFDVLQFFQVEDEDLNPIRDEKDKRKSQVVGEVISEPMLLEQYVAIADYKKKQKNEVNLSAGIGVEVVEKNENGWWFVNVEDEQGWVPASYLEPAEGGSGKEEQLARATRGEEEKFVTVQEYQAQNRDEISFEKGVVVEVVQKNLEGWWVVRYQGKEGVVPAAYLQYMNARPVEMADTCEVEVVATASAAVVDTLAKQVPGNASASVPTSSSSTSLSSSRNVAVEAMGVQRQTSKQAVPPRRQSIRVTKKMRSQSRSREGAGGGSNAKRAAALTAAISESTQETTSGQKPVKKMSGGSPLPSSANHVKVACTYKAVGGSELTVHEGDMVEVIERNESSWWYVKSNGNEGWVPSSSFDASNEPFSPPDSPGRSLSPVANTAEEPVYMTIGDFQSAADDGISFSSGRKVEVFEKAASGWWFVAIDGVEGWAPSSYIEKKSASEVSASMSSSSGVATKAGSMGAAVAASKAALRPAKSVGDTSAAKTTVSASKSTPDNNVASEISKVSLKPTAKSTGSIHKAAGQSRETESTNSSDGASSQSRPVSKQPAVAGGLDLSKVALKPVGSKTPGNKSADQAVKPPLKPGKSPQDQDKSGDNARHSSLGKSSGNSRHSSLGKPSGPVLVPSPRSKRADMTPAKPVAPSKSPKLPVKAAVAAADTAAAKPAAQAKGPIKPPTSAASKSDEKSSSPASANGPSTAPKGPIKPKGPATPARAPKSPSALKRSDDADHKTSSPRYVAIGDYAAEGDDSLGFKEGDIMELIEKSDTGWWMMKLGSKEGWAPSTYFELKEDKPTKSNSGPGAGNKEKAVPAAAAGVGSIAAQISQIQEAKLKKASVSKPEATSPDVRPKRTGPPVPKALSKSPSGKTQSEQSDRRSVSKGSAAKQPLRPKSPPGTKKSKTSSTTASDKPSSKGDVYIVTADYTAPDKEELSLKDGEEVTLVEKSDSGWWCVRLRGKEGWAPSTYLEKKRSPTKAVASKPLRPKANPAKKAGTRASAAYHGEEGEVSFEEGESLEILERADTGWWFVRTQSGVEGWAPSTYIE